MRAPAGVVARLGLVASLAGQSLQADMVAALGV